MVPSRLIVTLALTLGSGAAMAHSGHSGAGFAAGLAHPFTGLDHLLAMVAVGLLAARQPGAGRWALPAGFVLAMMVGALLGAAGVALPMQEAGVASSLLVFGVMIAWAARASLAVALPIVSLFALFHGGAHFAEMGQGTLVTYVGGFVLASVFLHGAGWVLGQWVPQHRAGVAAKRMVGGLIAGTGLLLLGS